MAKSSSIDLKILAQRIQLTRKVRGMTQTEMARLLICNYRHYQDIEAGKVNMRIDLLNSILEVLAVSPCFLFEDNNDLVNPPKHAYWCSDLLGSMQVPVELLNPDGLVTYWNTPYCKLMGYEKSEVEGLKYFWESVADKDLQEKLKEFLAAVKNVQHEPGIIPIVLKTKMGQQIPVVVKWDYVFNADGRLKGFIVIVDPHDVRVSAEKDLFA